MESKVDLGSKIIKARRLKYLTNCYEMGLSDKADDVIVDGDSFLFSYDDHGVRRIIYFAENYYVLDNMLSMLPRGRFYIEFLTKMEREFIPTNSCLVAKLMRMVNPDCRDLFTESSVMQYRDNTMGVLAKEEDTKEANQLLWETFHTEVSHLLSDEELNEVIKKRQLVLHRDFQTGKIDALLQMEVKPKKFYINQIINRTEKKVIHAILLGQLWDYTQNGGKYLYAWVDENNIASMKFHKKYGMQFDGMYNLVYCLERN